MELKFGLISCDSHGQLDRDAFTSRISKAKWGDKIPRVVEVEENGQKVEHWTVADAIFGGGVVNCPAVMQPHGYFPRRWEEVPRKVYDPTARLTALDEDGVDAEVLFPNSPVQNFGFYQFKDPEFELVCIRAYNDALADWRDVSDRYLPMALIPYLSPIETIVAEVEHAVKRGHMGIAIFAEPAMVVPGVKHSNDPFWEPLWATCQDLDVPVHWHGSAGLPLYVLPHWKGYSNRQLHSAMTGRLGVSPTQAIPNLMLSGRLDRYPDLKWIFAETGMGWVNYCLESCDHEWEQRHLWTEGIVTRPSESFRRQIIVDFWFEMGCLELRHKIGIDNIMWESDYPHITSTYPNSWEYVRKTVVGLPKEEQKKLLYENAMRIYKLAETATPVAQKERASEHAQNLGAPLARDKTNETVTV